MNDYQLKVTNLIAERGNIMMTMGPFFVNGSCRRLYSLRYNSRLVSSDAKQTRRRRIKKWRDELPIPPQKDLVNSVMMKAHKQSLKNVSTLDAMADNRLSRNLQQMNLGYAGEVVSEKLQEAQAKLHAFFGSYERPPRVGPIMDIRWWFWNWAFGTLPALAIVIFCEYQRPQYEAYHEQQIRRQQDKFKGFIDLEQELLDDEPQQNDSEFDLAAKDKDAHIIMLHQRIENLETKFRKQQQLQQRKQYMLEYADTRANQSGVQNRNDDRTLDELLARQQNPNISMEEPGVSLKEQLLLILTDIQSFAQQFTDRLSKVYQDLLDMKGDDRISFDPKLEEPSEATTKQQYETNIKKS